MKKTIFTFSALAMMLIGTKAYSQTLLSPTVLAAGGGFGQSATHTLSYTIGEMVAVNTLTGSSSILTQGFQQPTELSTSIRDVASGVSFNVYPVPASSSVTVESSLATFEVMLTSVDGKLISAASAFEGKANLPLDKVAAGVYMVYLKNTNNQLVGVKQIIKE